MLWWCVIIGGRMVVMVGDNRELNGSGGGSQ